MQFEGILSMGKKEKREKGKVKRRLTTEEHGGRRGICKLSPKLRETPWLKFEVIGKKKVLRRGVPVTP
jgi:hypothetical protein